MLLKVAAAFETSPEGGAGYFVGYVDSDYIIAGGTMLRTKAKITVCVTHQEAYRRLFRQPERSCMGSTGAKKPEVSASLLALTKTVPTASIPRRTPGRRMLPTRAGTGVC